MPTKRPGVKYIERKGTLYFVGYNNKTGQREFITEKGLAIVAYDQDTMQPIPVSCRFVGDAMVKAYTHSRDGFELDPEDYEYYEIGIAIGPKEGVPYLDRVWFTDDKTKSEAFKKIIEGYESFMLDGYTSQEDLEASIAAVAREL